MQIEPAEAKERSVYVRDTLNQGIQPVLRNICE